MVNPIYCRKCKDIDYTIADFIETEPKEDSITDFLIWQLQKHFKGFKLNVTIYRRKQESKTGTDFYISNIGLFFIYKTTYFGIAIQAKKLLDHEVYCDKTLTYKVGNSGKFQIDILENFAKRRKYIPLYLFYTPLMNNHCQMNCLNCWLFRYYLQLLVKPIPISFLHIPLFTSLHLQSIKYLKPLKETICNNTNKIKRELLLRNSLSFCCLFCSPIALQDNPSPVEHILELLWFIFFREEYSMWDKFKKIFLKKGIPKTLQQIVLGQEEAISEEMLENDGLLIKKDSQDIEFLKFVPDNIKNIFAFRDMIIVSIK